MADLLVLAFGYFLGAIPFGLVLTRLAGTADIRSIGSKNIGATNVLRTGRKDLAIATLLLDALKGTFAVWFAARWGDDATLVAGLGAFLGHLFPVWLKFQGGKGVATFLGVLLALWWPGFLLFAALWLGVAYATRYSSLAALVGAGVTPLVSFAVERYQGGSGALSLVLILMAAMLIFKHKANIARLRAGTESRIGQDKVEPAA